MNFSEAVRALASAYNTATLWVSGASGASEPILHIHAGLAAFVFAWLLSRRQLDSISPFMFVLVLALLNEVFDFLHQGLKWPEVALDVGLTVFWPLVLTATFRAKARRS